MRLSEGEKRSINLKEAEGSTSALNGTTTTYFYQTVFWEVPYIREAALLGADAPRLYMKSELDLLSTFLWYLHTRRRGSGAVLA